MKSRRRSKSQYAILGVIAERPCSGYEIKKFIEGSIGFFWHESFGQIYPVLKALERDGLIRSVEADLGNKARNRHCITARGKKTLAEWLAEPHEAEVIRNEMLLKLFFASHGAARPMIEHLKEQQSRNKELHGKFEAINASMPTEADGSGRFWRLTLDYGRRAVEAEQQWLGEAIQALARS